MLLLPLALVASLTTTTDRLGGPTDRPEVLPAAGTRSGWQATRTTRWVRFQTPTCTQITFDVGFERGTGHKLRFRHDDAGADAMTDYYWDQIRADGAGKRTVVVQSTGPSFDVGFEVRDYTTVSLTWASVPCPPVAASTGELPDFLQALIAAPKGARGGARGAFEKAGFELDMLGDPEDPFGVGATIGYGELAAELEADLSGETATVTIEAQEGKPGGDIHAIRESALAALARLGRPRLEYKDAGEERWHVSTPALFTRLTVSEARAVWSFELAAKRP